MSLSLIQILMKFFVDVLIVGVVTVTAVGNSDLKPSSSVDLYWLHCYCAR